MKSFVLLAALGFGLSLATVPPAQADATSDLGDLRGFDFQQADMVAMVGATFFERDGQFGYLETALSQAHPTRQLRFRNLAWSGDTVWGHARSYFGPPQEGLDRLQGQLQLIKPTVVLCQYGAAEAWDGPGKIDAFLEGYRKLLDLIDTAAAHPRVVLLSPVPGESRAAAPGLAAYHASLALYRDAIRRLADERRLPFVDLFALAQRLPHSDHPLTENGLHYSPEGYRAFASLVPLIAGDSSAAPPINEGLRALVIEKNRLFFHRWRPANETYLFGFRKHEQGRNGAEIPLFDPLVEGKEKEIAALLADRRP